MFLDKEKIFYGPVRRIVNRTYVDSNKVTVTTQSIRTSLFYQVSVYSFFDLITKDIYTSDTSIRCVGDYVVNKEELKSIDILFNKLDIISPKKLRTSSKILKLVKNLIINETMFKTGNMAKDNYDELKFFLNSNLNNIRYKQKKKSLHKKREN